MESASHSTYQLNGIILTLRDDLNFGVRESRGQKTWIIEDQTSGRFYRIGEAEYAFLKTLDGQTNFATALGRSAADLRDQSLTSDEAANFCQWLVATGLARTEQSQSLTRLVSESDKGGQRKSFLHGWGPLSQKLPLFNPNRTLENLEAAFGWLLSAPATFCFAILIAFGVGHVATEWDRVVRATGEVVSPSNWIWLILSWLVLRLIHEAAHGIACRRYGGHVREAGIVFILFVPLPYIDVTSTWRFSRRWQRLAVSAAGMWAEICLAAIAAIIWARTEPGVLNQQAFNVMLSASLTTLLFNANPLMRFDGYYLLTDFLEMPNLASHGQQWIRHVGKRWLFGLKSDLPKWPEGRTWVVGGYAVAAAIWRVVISVSLTLAADIMFFGAGIVIAGIAVIGWAVVPLLKFLKFALFGSQQTAASRIRFTAISCSAILLLTGIFTLVAWPSRHLVPAVLGYYPQAEVRAATSGFVKSVLVKDGQTVREGQLLMELEDRQLDVDIKVLQAEIEESELRSGALLDERLIAAMQSEDERRAALKGRLRQLLDRQESLRIVSPTDGVVLTSQLTELDGRYLQAGELILTIGGTTDEALMALADSEQRAALQGVPAVPVHLHGSRDWKLTSNVTRVSDRAQRDLITPSLGAQNGGPLPVRLVHQQADGNSHEATYELLEPRFLVELEPPAREQSRFQSGQLGMIKVYGAKESLAESAVARASEWWSRRQVALVEQWQR